MEWSLLGLLVIAVLLLVVMPVLLYFVGWGVARFTRKAPGRIVSPVSQQRLNAQPDIGPVRSEV
jgi:hypothetical protein